MDTINDEDWSDMKDDYHYDADTYDRTGRPIGTLNVNLWKINIRNFLNNYWLLPEWLYCILWK